MEFSYEGVRRVSYGDNLVFVPVCSACGRFVKADDTVKVNGLSGQPEGENATCSKCGRVAMPCEGYVP